MTAVSAAGRDGLALGPGRSDHATISSPADEEIERVIDATRRLADIAAASGMTSIKVGLGDLSWEFTSAVPASTPHLVGGSRPPKEPQSTPSGHQISAPLVGVFYRSTSPGETPFVEPGRRVEVGQQLAIVEAMKLMNAIIADQAGIVREIHVGDGDVVEFGQKLITLDPA